MDNSIDKIIHELFDRYWDADLTEEEETLIDDKAEALVLENSWEKVFFAFINYLHTNCKSPEKAINAAYIFWNLGWYDNFIPEPHKFLGYFYYRIDFNTSKYDPTDILDSLATTILAAQGFEEADLYKHPYYMPENDVKIQQAVEYYKKKLD